MSFSWEVKKKLCENVEGCRFCKRAELAGIIGFSGEFSEKRLRISTEHKEVLKTIVKSIEQNIGVVPKTSGDKIYKIVIENENILNNIREYVCLTHNVGDDEFFNEIVLSDCCKRAYVRGAFLGGGYVSDPGVRYHIEFDTKYKKSAERLRAVMEKLGLFMRITDRKEHYLGYFKDSNSISDTLGIMGADFGALSVMYAQMEKDVRNDINRQVNCEAANAEKLAQAAGIQLGAIRKIEKKMGLENIPNNLAQIAALRIEYPEDSLKQLGEKCEPPIGKSGANHRMNKIIEIAGAIK